MLKVETCASCRGYLKSVATLQQIPPFALLLQDLETVELDLVALDRGTPGRREAASRWLLRCLSADDSGRGHGTSGLSAPSGSVWAMALDVLAEWRLAQTSEVFRSWLDQGARSDDAKTAER